MLNNYQWWQKGVIYQIYPRSFQDSNGDGIGDLPGIIERLDYIKQLNVEAIWISPIYPSPMHDFGYDVSDYCDIHPIFGTMADFERLLAEAHSRDLKIILDLVPNHTSDEHPWFIESRSSRDNPRRDWYIWRDPAPNGGPPNNWPSVFGGPAWTFDEKTGQYYLHQFDTHQPELNYRNPAVMAAMQDVMRFWLDKGVDGFRVDVIFYMLKDDKFRDNPPNPDWNGKIPALQYLPVHNLHLPGVHDLIKQMRAVMDAYDDRVMIGEIFAPIELLVKYYGQNMDECHLPFNFHLILTETFDPVPWTAPSIRKIVEDYEAALPKQGWPNWVLGNHDQPRVASRVGPGQARVANMLLLTLRGTPTTYYGEEIGMENVKIPAEYIQDPPAVHQPELADEVGRDPQRTPMQWHDGPNAGFAAEGVQSWLPLSGNYPQRNVAQQKDDPTSMLNLYQTLTQLRQSEPALCVGSYATVESGAEPVLAYLRTAPDADRFLVVLNFGDKQHTLNFGHVAAQATIAVATDMKRSGPLDLSNLLLQPNEGMVLRLA